MRTAEWSGFGKIDEHLVMHHYEISAQVIQGQLFSSSFESLFHVVFNFLLSYRLVTCRLGPY